MLCSKWHKKISQDEEIQIEGSMICKECSLIAEVIAKCCTCFWPIYKGDLTHENSGSISLGFAGFINFTRSGKSIQCDWCYRRWLSELKEEEEWWKENKKALWACAIILLGLGIFLLFLNPVVSLVAFVPLVVLAILPALRSLLIRANRYEPRERKRTKIDKLFKRDS